MLEQQALRVTPWTCAAPAAPLGSGPMRMVRALDGDAMLGLVRQVRGPSWLGCGPRRLDICETEDAALLMSIEHGWFGFGRWQVLDAERCRVGSVMGDHLLDEQGGRFATISQESVGASVIRKREGTVLARLETALDGAQTMRFADDLQANPFLRMMLLAACVLRSEW